MRWTTQLSGDTFFPPCMRSGPLPHHLSSGKPASALSHLSILNQRCPLSVDLYNLRARLSPFTQSLSQSPRGLFIAFEKQPFEQTCNCKDGPSRITRSIHLSPGRMPAAGSSGPLWLHTHTEPSPNPAPLRQRECIHQLTSAKALPPNFLEWALSSFL